MYSDQVRKLVDTPNFIDSQWTSSRVTHLKNVLEVLYGELTIIKEELKPGEHIAHMNAQQVISLKAFGLRLYLWTQSLAPYLIRTDRRSILLLIT